MPADFNNLILDELKIEKLSAEDKSYLEEFTNLETLAMNEVKLNSLQNFPKIENLLRLELNDNFIGGSEVSKLAENAKLHTLKLAQNKITTLDDINPLKSLSGLKNLDLLQNEVTKVDGYKDAVFALIPSLEVLDGYNRDGEEVFSEDEDYGDYGEEGEEEVDEEFLTTQLTPDQLEELKKRGLTAEEFFAGKGDFGDDGEEDDYGEEGEEELYGDEADEAPNGGKVGEKRAHEGDKAGDAEKRAKEDK